MRLLLVFALVACSSRAPEPVIGAPRWAFGLPIRLADTPQAASAIAFDHSGDLVAAGRFDGTVDFGSGPATTQVIDGAGWISKRSGADGSQLWTHVLDAGTSDSNGTIVAGVTIDADDAVIATGTHSGAVDFGGVSLAGESGFVAKYAASGTLTWVIPLAASVGSVAVASDGTILVVAAAANATPMGGRSIVALQSDGTIAWQQAVPFATEVHVASDGDVIASGDLTGVVTVAGQTLSAIADTSEAIARFAPDGTLRWATVLGHVGISDMAVRAAPSADDGAIVSCERPGSQSVWEPSVAAIDRDGHERWRTKEVTSAGASFLLGLAVTTSGTTIGVGSIGDYTVDLGTGEIDGCGFLATWERSGAADEVHGYGNAALGACGIVAAATSPAGEVGIAAASNQALDFGTGGVSGMILAVFDAP